MFIARIVFAVMGVLFVIAAQAAAPGLDFGAGPPTIRGFSPGTKIAWMAMVRERVNDRSHMTVLRGVEPVTPNGHLAVDRADRDFSRSIWLVAEVDGTGVLSAGAPLYPPSPEAVELRAVKGESTISVRSPSVHLTVIRRRGGGVWMFAAADGSTVDGDGLQNGSVLVRLDALKPFRGNPNPPPTLAAGDLLLLFDAHGNRAAVVEVSE